MSLLDEAHRRTRSNMQTIERRLRLDFNRGGHPTTETVLTDLQAEVLSTAAFHRTLCRSGRFDQLDFAVYLKLIASALSASIGGGPKESAPGAAGWALDRLENSVTWIDDSCEIHAPRKDGSSLDRVLEFVPEPRQPMAHRALCATAVVVPPTLFRWRSPGAILPGCGCARPIRPREAWVRLRVAADALAVDVSIAEGSLGLPRDFDPELKPILAGQIAHLLDRLLQGATIARLGSPPVFKVTFVPSGDAGGLKGHS